VTVRQIQIRWIWTTKSKSNGFRL